MTTQEAERAQIVRSLTEATLAIQSLEETGDFRYQGLTLNQWWDIRTKRTIELDGLDDSR